MKRLVLPLAGCLVAGSVLAFPERPAIEQALKETAQALTSLSHQTLESPCQGDIEIAAAYLKAAAMKVHYQRFVLALTDLGYSQNELQAIAGSRDWCKNIAVNAVPFINQVRDIKAQVEILSRVQE
ncbi:Uncharacterised protein [Legionella donaldsonii]|uniref:Uncharacterized protein n=1 Tax=Legionella donaldsonii TaxID=45060 RepID=A0A378KJR6_9GAMM|nr:hypothetical protein [Legionella donaldsonii]STX84886.1 Uncharacterised protein [Legionella donaldsonii]